jgi:hypothetical protein
MFVGEVAFDMQDVADDAFCDQALELAHARKASLIVTESEGHAGLFASRNGPFGFSASEGKRFFAPNRLAGGRRGGNLPNMQGVRRCKKNRLNAWIGNGLFEFGRQFEVLGGCEIADKFGLLAHTADKSQALAFALNRINDIFSPAAETDYCGIDHE